MEFQVKQFLEQAQEAKRFEHVDCQYLERWVYCESPNLDGTSSDIHTLQNHGDRKLKVQKYSDTLQGELALNQWLERKAPGGPESEAPELAGYALLGGLRLLIQSSVPKHDWFGKPDKLPFSDLDTFRKLKIALNLPQAYVLALDNSNGVVEYCSTDSDSASAKLDFIAQNTNYHNNAWSLALSHDPKTGITTGFLRADGEPDEEALIKHLRKPERGIDVDGMIKNTVELKQPLNKDTALEYLKSAEPSINVDAVLKTLKSYGRQLNSHEIMDYFKFYGFQVALEAPSIDSDRSGSDIDVDTAISRQQSLGLHYDIDIISKELDAFGTRIDVEAILKHVKASQEQVMHPMLLPAIMYRNLKVSSEEHLNDLHRDIDDLERRLRHVRVRRKAVPRDGLVEDQELLDEELDYRSLSSLSRRLNTCKKDQASRDGRHKFREQFQTQLEKAAKGVRKSSVGNSTKPDARERSRQILKAGHELEQWISFNTRIFEFEEGRDVNYRARIAVQLDLLYSLISQKQRRTQEQIAKSTGEDSADVKYVAYLGSIFLPASLMAAIFELKGWQSLFAYFVATSIFVGLVFIMLRYRSWLSNRYKQLKAYKTKFFGFGPPSNEFSGGKPDSLDWDSVDRPRGISVSSVGRC